SWAAPCPPCMGGIQIRVSTGLPTLRARSGHETEPRTAHRARDAAPVVAGVTVPGHREGARHLSQAILDRQVRSALLVIGADPLPGAYQDGADVGASGQIAEDVGALLEAVALVVERPRGIEEVPLSRALLHQPTFFLILEEPVGLGGRL